MFGSLSIATSGIRAAQVNLAVTGHNISNSEIPGFSRQRVIQTTAFPRHYGVDRAGNRMHIEMGTDWTAVHQIRNEFLDISYRQNIGRLQFYSTVVQTGMVIESLLGELHGAYNFQSVLNDMWTRIQELSTNPSGIDTRQLFLATANSFLMKSQDVFTGLVNYQLNLDEQIRAIVTEINHTANEINRLNFHILAEEASGDNANDARDERNRLVDRMAEMLPIDTFTAPDGTVVIMSQGHTIVSQGFVNTMGLRYISNEFSFVEPVFTRSATVLSAGTPPHEFTAFTNYRRPINNANRNDFGQLNALLMARGTSPVTHMSAYTPRPIPPVTVAPVPPTAPTPPPELTVPIDSDSATWGGAPSFDDAWAQYVLDWEQRELDMAQFVIDWEQHVQDMAQYVLEWNSWMAYNADPENVLRNYHADVHNWNALMWSVQHAKIPRVQQNLDRIVNSVATMVNDALTGNLRRYNAQGVLENVFDSPPLDMNGNEGIPLFIRRIDTLGGDDNITWPFTDVDPNSVNTIFTINNIQINPAFLALDGHNFLALSPSGAPDDNTLLIALQAIWQSNTGPYAVNIGGRNFSVQDAYIRFTGDIATQISEANSFVAATTIQVQQADHLRQAVKGVSMDEELNAMLRFQFAFQSAARVLNVIDGMIDQVVNRTGRVGL